MANKQLREVIGGGRRRGKTTELIKRASRERLYILCPNRNMAKFIFERAEDMGLNIPFPVTIEDLPLTSPHINEVLVDESEMVLEQLIGKRIAGMSTSMKMSEFYTIEEQKELSDQAKSVGELTAKLSIDVSDALTGLKAVQRGARKATQSLKELEEQQDKMIDLPLYPEVSG